MALTGELVRVGTGSGFGTPNENRPRGCSGFGTENLFVIGAQRRRLIRITDLENATGAFASAQLPNPVFSLSEFDGNLYVTNHTNLLRISPPFAATSTYTDLGVIAVGVSIRSLDTDGTHLWGYDKNDDKLYQITPAQASLSAVEWVTVEYPSNVSNPNIDALLYFDGRWYVTDRGTDALYILPETLTQGSTVQASRVGNFTDYGAGCRCCYWWWFFRFQSLCR